VSRSWASYRSAIALKASSWGMLWRVQTTDSLKFSKPAAARFSMARTAMANEPSPRTASLTSAVAPSSEICTSV
jgi:hypothetical protein